MSDDPYLSSEELGPRVRELREAAGLSPEELADGACCTVEVIAGLEMGASTPTVSELLALADALNTTAEDLLLREADPAPLFRNAGGERAADLAQNEMESIMADFLSFRSVVGG
jgi:transcriptional regulator with XRE-family HTH domain